jgi:hypothetical protein
MMHGSEGGKGPERVRVLGRRGPPARVLLPVAASMALWSAPAPVHACGGFFCDRPAAANPVPVIAQAAENVMFALDRDPQTGAGLVEAHIQIKYSGAADQFSWIVPMTSLPTLDVGSDVLFQVLEPKTRPTFTTQFLVDGSCQMSNGGGSSFACGGSAAESAAPGGTHDGDAGHTPTVDVSFRGNIGPYESAVIRSDDAGALETWLVDQGYFVSPEASQIIQQYVATRSYFVALRLRAGQDVSEIRPIIVRLIAEEGCLPLRLTAIAATPDVRINVWVLGAARAVPVNYEEFTINLAKLDWFGNGANYDKLVGDAANEAGGNAFLAEYAQPTASAAPWFNVSPAAQATLAAATTPSAFMGALQALGLTVSGRVLEVLRAQLPEPDYLKTQGVSEAQFYAVPYAYLFPTSIPQFDSAAAAAQMETDVLAPMRALHGLFTTHAYLTRLATFISPDEMTKDPLFITNPTLPAISNLHTAVAHVLCGNEDFGTCGAPVRLDITGGRSLRYRSTGIGSCGAGTQAFDRADLDTTLPAAEQVYRRDADGPGTLLMDQAPQITAALAAHDRAIPTGSGDDCAVARRTRLSAPGILVLVGAGAVLRARRRRRLS